MEKIKIAFVILHYNTIVDTKECVQSIEQFVDYDKYAVKIIIVDNASPNGSWDELYDFYHNDSKIHLIKSDKNIGFARGNNLGFVYAKEHLKSDFIILLNNDTLLLEKDFCDLIVREYQEYNYAVAGPKVITPTEPYDSNPGPSNVKSISFYEKDLFQKRVLLLANYFYLDVVYKKMKSFFVKRKKDEVLSKKIDERCENVQLHGCFLIFSPLYIKKFDGLNPRTFLYHEEDLLFIRLKKSGMKSLYLPNLKIYHKEDRATKSIPIGNHKRLRFMYKNYILSDKVVIDELRMLNQK